MKTSYRHGCWSTANTSTTGYTRTSQQPVTFCHCVCGVSKCGGVCAVCVCVYKCVLLTDCVWVVGGYVSECREVWMCWWSGMFRCIERCISVWYFSCSHVSQLTNKMDYFAARDAAAGGAGAQALAQAGAMCEVSMCQVVREFVCVCVFVL